MRQLFKALVIVGVTAAAGCASQPSAPATSTVRGQIQQETFPATVSKVTIVSDKGVTTTVPVGTHGEFSLVLAKGTGYRFFLSADGKGTPLVLRDNQSRLETGILVNAGGATVDLGAVRFVGAGPATRTLAFKPGAGGQAAQSCSDGNDGEQSDGNDGEQSDDGEQTDSGGDCVDGIDAQTHQPCDGGPAANQNDGEQSDDIEQADASEAMGVTDLAAPSSIGCSGGGDDGEEAD
jgi:hypothetical protein